MSVFIKGGKGWDDVDIVGVVFFVSLSEIMGWFFGVGVVGQCVVVCCDCAIDVEVGGAEMASAVADAGVLVLWDLG